MFFRETGFNLKKIGCPKDKRVTLIEVLNNER
jgi:hypothetical protein